MAMPQILPSTSSSIIPNKSHLSPNNHHLNHPVKPFIFSQRPPPLLRQWRRKPISVRCSASSFSEKHHTNSPNSDDVVELPLFPLPLVLFPGAILPLQIFEFRYRMMMHTLLQTDLRFGVIYTDAATGTADVGCVGEVVKHERLVDDRFFLICKGQERFRVTKLVRTKPYLVAEVTWLEDRPSVVNGDEDLNSLANEVETYMKDVIRLSNRLNGKPEKEVQDLRRNLFPTPFSFFVGSTFEGAPREQQALLELEDTATRLKREKETLRNTLNYLTAASAVVNESDVHNIVLSYLVHNCFKDTVESFTSCTGMKQSLDHLEDMEKRKKIFQFASEGNALKAIELTGELAPDLLEKNKDLHFDLLSLHFVELVCSRKCKEALEFAQSKLTPFGKVQKHLKKLEDFIALLAYEEPEKSPMFHLLSSEYRQHVAESLNRAILAHANLPGYSALERLIQQTTVVRQCLSQECSKEGHPPFSVNDFIKS